MTSVPSIEAESVLITGVYGAGKSSVAEEIAVALEPEPSDSVPSTSLAHVVCRPGCRTQRIEAGAPYLSMAWLVVRQS